MLKAFLFYFLTLWTLYTTWYWVMIVFQYDDLLSVFGL